MLYLLYIPHQLFDLFRLDYLPPPGAVHPHFHWNCVQPIASGKQTIVAIGHAVETSNHRGHQTHTYNRILYTSIRSRGNEQKLLGLAKCNAAGMLVVPILQHIDRLPRKKIFSFSSSFTKKIEKKIATTEHECTTHSQIHKQTAKIQRAR